MIHTNDLKGYAGMIIQWLWGLPVFRAILLTLYHDCYNLVQELGI
jgi:hypothetical protein